MHLQGLNKECLCSLSLSSMHLAFLRLHCLLVVCGSIFCANHMNSTTNETTRISPTFSLSEEATWFYTIDASLNFPLARGSTQLTPGPQTPSSLRKPPSSTQLRLISIFLLDVVSLSWHKPLLCWENQTDSIQLTPISIFLLDMVQLSWSQVHKHIFRWEKRLGFSQFTVISRLLPDIRDISNLISPLADAESISSFNGRNDLVHSADINLVKFQTLFTLFRLVVPSISRDSVGQQE